MSTPNSGRRRKASEFHLPDGKRIIVALPDEAAYLREKYANTNDAEIQVEVVVHGTDEHRCYLRQTLSHAEQRREALREQHGPAFDEWLNVQAHVDAMTEQLDRLADHSTALNASFSKFGYDAQLRTYNDHSGTGTPTPSETASGKSDWDDKYSGETIKLFKRPVIKQYFHRGLLWRASEETQIMSFELFLDLLYVGIIHINGEHLADEANGHELLRFVVTFGMSWKIWSDIAQAMAWFETNDIFQRIQILFQIACLLGFTTNMIQSFSEDEKHNTYTQLVSFYLAARLFGAVQLLLTGALLPLIKEMMLAQAAIIVIPSALWIASVHVDMPNRLALVFIALASDIFGASVIVGSFRYARSHETPLAKILMDKLFEFYPALNIEHKVERTNALVSLVIGYSVVGVMFQNYAFSINAFLGKAILGLVQAFMFNWLYFEVDGENLYVHAIRRSANTALLWQYSHLVFIMGYIVASAALSKLVVMGDTANADPHDLTHHYEDRSEEDMPNGVRFFYCHGLALALLGMACISLSHRHKRPMTQRFSKSVRLGNRMAVCVILFFLPMAKELTSLSIISITVALTFWVLLFEIAGGSCRDDPFIGTKEGCCVRYSAKCSGRDLASATKSDGKVDVVALYQNDKTAGDLQG